MMMMMMMIPSYLLDDYDVQMQLGKCAIDIPVLHHNFRPFSKIENLGEFCYSTERENRDLTTHFLPLFICIKEVKIGPLDSVGKQWVMV